MKRRGNFEIFYDDCETEVLKLLHNYNMTFASLARESDVPANVISGLAYGTISPITISSKKQGQIKPAAQRICDYFSLEVSEVFPRYLCSIDSKYKHNAHELCPWTTYSEIISSEKYVEEYVLNCIESQEILRKLKLYFSTRNYEIFIKKIMFDASYGDLVLEYNVSSQTITDTINKGLMYLNKRCPKIAKKVENKELAQKLREEYKKYKKQQQKLRAKELRKLRVEELKLTQDTQTQSSYKPFEFETETQNPPEENFETETQRPQKNPICEQSESKEDMKEQKKSIFSKFINFFKNKSL